MRGMEPFAAAKGVWSIIRELSLDEIREAADRPPRLLLLSNQHDAADGSRPRSPAGPFRRGDDSPAGRPGRRRRRFDAVVLFDPEGSVESKERLDALRSSEHTTAAVAFLSSDPSDQRALRLARAAILKQNPDRQSHSGDISPAFDKPRSSRSTTKPRSPMRSSRW